MPVILTMPSLIPHLLWGSGGVTSLLLHSIFRSYVTYLTFSSIPELSTSVDFHKIDEVYFICKKHNTLALTHPELRSRFGLVYFIYNDKSFTNYYTLHDSDFGEHVKSSLNSFNTIKTNLTYLSWLLNASNALSTYKEQCISRSDTKCTKQNRTLFYIPYPFRTKLNPP